MTRYFAPLLASALLATSANAQDVKPGDPQAARSKIAMCIGCHSIPGYQSSFPEVHKVPKISGQSEGYLAAALTAYRKGDRKHPTMKAIAASLSDQDIADLAAYYAQHQKAKQSVAPKAPSPSAEVQALLTKGACLSCHGDNFSKPLDASYPKLAGQHADYLYVALKAYQTDKKQYLGRANPIMAASISSFNHRELKLMANYIASLPGTLEVVPQPPTR